MYRQDRSRTGGCLRQKRKRYETDIDGLRVSKVLGLQIVHAACESDLLGKIKYLRPTIVRPAGREKCLARLAKKSPRGFQ
jgi:hypothetical protein